VVDLAFYAGWVFLMLVAAYWVIRLAVRHEVMDANARTPEVPSDNVNTLRTR
jgi:hypothetical protein